MKKINNKLAEKTKDVEKWKAASVDPALHFTTGQNEGKYTADRDEKGLPTTLANGDPVPKSQMKSNAKDHEKRVKARVKRFDGPATEPFESLNDQNFVKILSEFGKICQNPSKIVKFEES